MSEGEKEKQACSIRSSINSNSSTRAAGEASVPVAGFARCQAVAAMEGHGFCEKLHSRFPPR
jgi:hypothetical protein